MTATQESAQQSETEPRRGYWRRQCKFGTGSLGAETVSLAVVVETGDADDLNKLRGMLCGARLSARLYVDQQASDDHPGQETFIDTGDTLEAIAEVTTFRVTSSSIRLRLSFALDDVDPAAIARLVNASGRVEMKRIGAISDEAAE